MLTVALKGLAGRKLRSILTALAIVLGVAMISGTYVLTDTIKAAFDTIFVGSYRNADAIVTGKVAFTNHEGNGVEIPAFPESVLARVRALPDVAAIGGATFVIFDLPTAQRLFDKLGKLDLVRVAGRSGVPATKLVAEIQPLL